MMERVVFSIFILIVLFFAFDSSVKRFKIFPIISGFFIIFIELILNMSNVILLSIVLILLPMLIFLFLNILSYIGSYDSYKIIIRKNARFYRRSYIFGLIAVILIVSLIIFRRIN